LTENEEPVRIVLAEPADARILTSIQAEAFDHEAALFRMDTNRGPEGYDSVESTRELIDAGSLWKIMQGNEVVGGLVVTVLKDGRARINRIFVDPNHQRKGVGGRAVQEIQTRFSEASVWELDTPSWAVRNQKFYEKIGFVHVGHTLEPNSGFILYIYRMQGAGIR
jgi:GNAT superfamily N-acetyltransferase